MEYAPEYCNRCECSSRYHQSIINNISLRWSLSLDSGDLESGDYHSSHGQELPEDDGNIVSIIENRCTPMIVEAIDIAGIASFDVDEDVKIPNYADTSRFETGNVDYGGWDSYQHCI